MPSPFFIGTAARFRGASWFDYSVAGWSLKGTEIGNKSSNECNAVGANIPKRVAFMGMGRNSRCPHRRGSPVLPLWAGKLFVPERREQMRQTLIEAHVSFPEFNALFVSTLEFVFGLLLVFGAITRIACVMLSGLMIVAIATTAIRNIKATSKLGWLSEFFYLPEVLCLVILVWLFFSGPGWLSVDHLIVSKIHLYLTCNAL